MLKLASTDDAGSLPAANCRLGEAWLTLGDTWLSLACAWMAEVWIQRRETDWADGCASFRSG
ncbi:MAG: hypothetical protein ABIQ99_01585 [Thermoflexales bacterium]